jgi:hypothetical protein
MDVFCAAAIVGSKRAIGTMPQIGIILLYEASRLNDYTGYFLDNPKKTHKIEVYVLRVCNKTSQT